MYMDLKQIKTYLNSYWIRKKIWKEQLKIGTVEHRTLRRTHKGFKIVLEQWLVNWGSRSRVWKRLGKEFLEESMNEIFTLI